MKDSDIKVSVVIPVFNHEKYVRQCIESVLNQTYPDVEIVIIDDGSNDNSVSVIDEVIKGKKNINFSVQNNHGAHYTINKAIELCTGSFINIINSDDLFAHDRIEKLVNQVHCSKKPLRFLFSKVIYIDETGNNITLTDQFCRKLLSKQNQINHCATVGYSVLLSNVSISTGNMFFDKSLYYEVGGFRNYKYVHDWDFLLRCLIRTEPYYLDENLYLYRLHTANTFRSLKDLAGIECPDVLRNYFNSVQSSLPLNELAPCKDNWPFYFDYFVRKSNLDQFYPGFLTKR